MAQPTKDIRWGWVEEQYRLGQTSTRAIADAHELQYGVPVTEGAIRRRAKGEGWERDLSAQIQRRVRRKLAERSVATQELCVPPEIPGNPADGVVSSPAHPQNQKARERRDQVIVEVTAEIATKKVEEHRKYAQGLHEMANRLEAHIMEQLPMTEDGRPKDVIFLPIMERLVELLEQRGNVGGGLIDQSIVDAILETTYNPMTIKAIAGAVASCAQARAKAIEIERKAWSLDDANDPRGGARNGALETLREFLGVA